MSVRAAFIVGLLSFSLLACGAAGIVNEMEDTGYSDVTNYARTLSIVRLEKDCQLFYTWGKNTNNGKWHTAVKTELIRRMPLYSFTDEKCKLSPSTLMALKGFNPNQPPMQQKDGMQ